MSPVTTAVELYSTLLGTQILGAAAVHLLTRKPRQ